jgi:Putative zinc-finger
VLASVVAYSRFREPRLHRAVEPVALRRHVGITVHAMTRIPSVRRTLLLAALTAMLSQAVFEFGPLWLVDLHAPATAFGPYWALLTATLGAGGYLAGRLDFARRATPVTLAVIVVASAIVFVSTHALLVVVAAQTVVALALAVTGIHAGRLLHDAVPSHIRAGVSSGAGTFSWLLFLPFSLVFGAVARTHGVYAAGWIFVGTCVLLALLLAASARTRRDVPVEVGGFVAVGDEPGSEALTGAPAPTHDLTCEQVVRLASDFLDGELPSDWRARITAHLPACEGCTTYLDQIEQTIELVAQLDADRSRPTPCEP